MTTWRKMILEEMKDHEDSWDSLVSYTLTDKELDAVFDSGYGGEEGHPFTAWTETRVYFPVCYDGAEWCASVPRNPNGHPTHHIGGG